MRKLKVLIAMAVMVVFASLAALPVIAQAADSAATSGRSASNGEYNEGKDKPSGNKCGKKFEKRAHVTKCHKR